MSNDQRGKKDSYYFSHDATANIDPKCIMLIDKMGLEGYGIFWVLIETLRSQPDYKCPLQIVPGLARRNNTTAEKMLEVINDYALFEVQDNSFFSNSLNRRMALSDAKRKALSEAGKRGYQEKQKKLKPPLSQDEATLKQLNETKPNQTNEIKEKNIINLRESFFLDFPSSQQIEIICSDLKIPKEKLILRIPEFRKSARPDYKNFSEFCNHFKNWYVKSTTLRNPDGSVYVPKKRNALL